MIQFELPKDKPSIIKVIGVGGGGSNAVNHMYLKGIKGVDFIVCNTDHQALQISPVPAKIQLGYSLTEGRGAGSIAEVGRNAAIENIEEIREYLSDGTKMVFITAGMGGGTGTGAAPIIAGLAKEMGILTVGIVTIPFGFEGKKRRVQAEEGLKHFKENVDTLLVICNDKLREIYGNLTLANAFAEADNILTTAARGIAEIITITGYVNVDFEDVKTVMTDSGVAIMGSASAEGENRSVRAVEEALSSPLLNDSNIEGARYILLNIASGTKDVTMDEIAEITDYIQESAGLTADIIWGNCIDQSLEEKLSVTIIATGFKTKQDYSFERPEAAKTVVHDLEEQPKVTEHAPAKEEVVEPEEPILVKKTVVQVEQSIPFEFEVASNEPEKAKVSTQAEQQSEAIAQKQTAENKEVEDDDQFRRSRERILKLREASLKHKSLTSVTIAEMENEPAYKRRNVKVDEVNPSSESEISRYTLSENDEKKPEIKPNNTFLHDNVD